MKHREDDFDVAMYIVVNSDLSMGRGKVAGQCCHSACEAVKILERNCRGDEIYRRWDRGATTKIVLRATEKEMLKLLDEFEVDTRVKRESNQVWCCATHDAGRTQIAEGSLTAIAFRPLLRDDTPDVLRKMKLY